MVRGYAPNITKIYMEQTSPEFAVGEKWDRQEFAVGEDGKPNANQDYHRGLLVNWVEAAGGSVTAFDFTTKGILQAAVQGELWRLKDSNGKPPGMIGVRPESAVTFIDNHDTWSQDLWPFPEDKIMLGYVYILTHPGTPTIVSALCFLAHANVFTFLCHMGSTNYKSECAMFCSSMITFSLSGSLWNR